MSFADILSEFGRTPTIRFAEPVTCPTCGQPVPQAYLGWLQPCGHLVGEDWIRDTLVAEGARRPPATDLNDPHHSPKETAMIDPAVLRNLAATLEAKAGTAYNMGGDYNHGQSDAYTYAADLVAALAFEPCGAVFPLKPGQDPCRKPKGHEDGPDTDWKRDYHSNGRLKWLVDGSDMPDAPEGSR